MGIFNKNKVPGITASELQALAQYNYQNSYSNQAQNAIHINDLTSSFYQQQQPLTNEQLQAQIDEYLKETRAQMRTTPFTGPTPEQLETYPSLAAAWDEYKTIAVLCGVNKETK